MNKNARNPGGDRNSNLELYRIIAMLLIIAHHYVVNSGVWEAMSETPLAPNSVFLYVFGMWGKIGINCFVLITGYFMCKSSITIRKFLKLLLEVEFYKVVFYILFVISGYEKISVAGLLKAILPITAVEQNFTGCYLIFYLTIPFLNILLKNISEKQHLCLLGLIAFTYVLWGTVLKNVAMNYVTWFICLYFIGSYIRLYPKAIFGKTKLWGVCSCTLALICIASVISCLWLGQKINRNAAYYFVTDCNTFLAVCMGVSSFLFFKNLQIKQSRGINMLASSTFGVLLIHANSNTMRTWLWKTVLNVKGMFSANTGAMVLHAILSIVTIFAICTAIDQIRKHTIEEAAINCVERKIRPLLCKLEENI